MIGTIGQWKAQFKIGNFDDFLSKQDFVSFVLVEEAGNILPTFDLQFYVYKNLAEVAHIFSYLNQGNTLEVSLGRDDPTLFNIRLKITHTTITRSGEERYYVKVTGILDAFPYLSSCNMRAIQGTGIEALSEVVNDTFDPDFNVNASQDAAMIWLQPNIPDKQFVDELWMHSYMPGSFLMTAITCDGKFRLRDMQTLKSSGGVTWNLINGSAPDQSRNEVSYDGNYSVETETGLSNIWVGYGRQKDVLDLNAGQEAISQQTTSPLLANTKTIDRSADVTNRIDAFGVINDNVHPNYWDAYWQNLRNLIIFSTVRIQLTLLNVYNPVRVLDLVYLTEIQGFDNQGALFVQGYYVVSKVAINIIADYFSTVIQLNREALNELKGDLA